MTKRDQITWTRRGRTKPVPVASRKTYDWIVTSDAGSCVTKECEFGFDDAGELVSYTFLGCGRIGWPDYIVEASKCLDGLWRANYAYHQAVLTVRQVGALKAKLTNFRNDVYPAEADRTVYPPC